MNLKNYFEVICGRLSVFHFCNVEFVNAWIFNISDMMTGVLKYGNQKV